MTENTYQLTIVLSQEEKDALASLAEEQRRNPGDQAAHLIRQALMEYGLIAWKPHNPILTNDLPADEHETQLLSRESAPASEGRHTLPAGG